MRRPARPHSQGRRADLRTLVDLDGIGPAMLRDLERPGVRDAATLARRDCDRLYAELCRRTGLCQDPCVLDTVRCAVAEVRDQALPPAQRRWW